MPTWADWREVRQRRYLDSLRRDECGCLYRGSRGWQFIGGYAGWEIADGHIWVEGRWAEDLTDAREVPA